jgi:triacylglycerol lipase
MAILAAFAALAAPQLAGAAVGPPLSLSETELHSALACRGPEVARSRQPVLLVHGTGFSAEDSWGWNYGAALPALGFETCTVAIPDHELGDAQRNAEYVVHAIRSIHGRTGRRVAVIGHSQGTWEPRWAMRFWPDIAPMVDDYISLAGPHHGIGAGDQCDGRSCPPVAWQFSSDSAFLAALNRPREVSPPVDATSIFTALDEFVQPPTTAVLSGASNVLLQDICPGRPVDHVLILADALTYRLALDALTHPGPADPSRIPGEVCGEASMPGVDAGIGLAAAPGAFLGALGAGLQYWTPDKWTTAEPPLAPYVSGSEGFGEISLRAMTRGLRVGARRTVRVQATVGGQPLRRASVRIGSTAVRTSEDGVASLRIRPRRSGRLTALGTAPAYSSGRTALRVLPRRRQPRR